MPLAPSAHDFGEGFESPLRPEVRDGRIKVAAIAFALWRSAHAVDAHLERHPLVGFALRIITASGQFVGMTDRDKDSLRANQ